MDNITWLLYTIPVHKDINNGVENGGPGSLSLSPPVHWPESSRACTACARACALCTDSYTHNSLSREKHAISQSSRVAKCVNSARMSDSTSTFSCKVRVDRRMNPVLPRLYTSCSLFVPFVACGNGSGGGGGDRTTRCGGPSEYQVDDNVSAIDGVHRRRRHCRPLQLLRFPGHHNDSRTTVVVAAASQLVPDATLAAVL
jgi:hypothetical protein